MRCTIVLLFIAVNVSNFLNYFVLYTAYIKYVETCYINKITDNHAQL